MNYRLPQTLTVNGREEPIRWEYTAVLDAIAALNDGDLEDYEKVLAFLWIIYENFEHFHREDYAPAFEAAMNFVNNDLDEQLVTAIAIKPANAEKAPIQYDRYTPISTDNIPASILEYAGADRSGAGYSVNDIAGMSDPPDRYMCTYWFSGYGRMVEKSIYKISGDARDFGQWERTDSDKQP